MEGLHAPSKVRLLEEPLAASTGALCSSEEIPLGTLKTLFPQLAEEEPFSDDESDGSSVESEEDGIVHATFREMISGKVALDPKSAAKKRRQSEGVRFAGGHICMYERDEQEYDAMHEGPLKPFSPVLEQNTNVNKILTVRFMTPRYQYDAQVKAQIALRKGQDLHEHLR